MAGLGVGLSVPNAGAGIAGYADELGDALGDREDATVHALDSSHYPVPVLGSYLASSVGVRRRISGVGADVDVVHLTAQDQAAGLLGVTPDVPVVVTVHDVTPLVTTYDNPLLRAFARVYAAGLGRADGVLAISEHTRSDLSAATSIDRASIEVVRPGIDVGWVEAPAPPEALTDLDVTPPYLLYVGQQTRKKNVTTAIEALADLPADLSLVVAGAAGRIPRVRIARTARNHGVADRVHRTGFVDRPTLARLYRDATAFLFPSRYEGFGRPPLEAMAAGTPVVATTATAVPEVVGDAALLCDPEDPAAWADAVRRLRTDPDLRDRLVERGHDRVERFDWARSAEETVQLYRSVLADRT